MYSVYQHWDPLKVCVVGRSYPPEFYSWITVPRVRDLFEKIAIETEEDYQSIIKKLYEFGVKVMRPDLPEQTVVNGKYVPPPMTPRDYTIMIGDTFYNTYNYRNTSFEQFYNDIKNPRWPLCQTIDEFNNLPGWIQEECKLIHKMDRHVGWHLTTNNSAYDKILNHIKEQGNTVKFIEDPNIGTTIGTTISGAMISRIGRDLYFGTENYNQDIVDIKACADLEFPNYRNHIVNTGGHSDGTYCPVCPGLIISLEDVPTYADTFPGWEVVYLQSASNDLSKLTPFLDLKNKTLGKWWIPGFEQDQDVVDTVKTWLDHWTGYVAETVFDVNMLIIDPKNVMVFSYNKQVFDTLNRYGITPHVVPFRHRYFWDGGVHCVTSDLHREGSMQDYFKGRN